MLMRKKTEPHPINKNRPHTNFWTLPFSGFQASWKADKYAWKAHKYAWRPKKYAWKPDKYSWRPDKYAWKVQK